MTHGDSCGVAAVPLVVSFMGISGAVRLLRLSAPVLPVERHIQRAEDVGGSHERADDSQHKEK